jgi:hypothetical protein
MWHDAKNEVGMESHTSLLMAKYGITSIPALVLLEQHGGLICANAWDKCVADAEGWNFAWRQQSQIPRIGEMGVRADSANWPRGQKKETPHQDHRHRLLRRQGRSRLLILTSPHRQGNDQNPHAQGPKHRRPRGGGAGRIPGGSTWQAGNHKHDGHSPGLASRTSI